MQSYLSKTLKDKAKIKSAFLLTASAVLSSIFLFSGYIYGAENSQKIMEDNTYTINATIIASQTQGQEKSGVADKLIGSSFKTLARAFLATANIEKLKKDNIDKLNRKDEEKFRKQYVKVYRVARKCPVVTQRYGLAKELTKEEAIEKIKNIKKKDLYDALNDIPDKVIADQFRQYFSERKQAVEESNIAVQVNQLWSKMMDSITGKKQKNK